MADKRIAVVGDLQQRAIGWIVVLVLLVAALGATVAVPPEPANAETVGDIFVVDVDCCGSGNGGVFRVNSATGAQSIVSSAGAFVSPVAVALSTSGLLYVVDASCCGGDLGGVIEVDPSKPNTPPGSNQRVISSGGNFTEPRGLALAADGSIYVVDAHCGCGETGDGGVVKVNPSTGQQTVVAGGGSFIDPVGIVLAGNGLLYIADASCVCGVSGALGGIIQVIPESGGQSVVSAGGNFVDPSGIVLGVDGQLYVADPECGCGNAGSLGGIVKVDPFTGAQTVVSAGGSFIDPNGIALSPDGQLYVADYGSAGIGSVFKVNPNGGAQTPVSTGAGFVNPFGLVAVPQVTIVSGPIVEGTGTNVSLPYLVSRFPRSHLPLTIPFTTTNGSATGGVDFTPTSGSVTIEVGETSATIPIQIVADNLDEGVLETFTVAFQVPNGLGTIGSSSVVMQIVDDEQAVLNAGDATALEPASGTRTMTIPVTLSVPHAQTVTVQYFTGSNTAGSSDIQSASGTLTFLSGETSKTVEVQVVGDGTAEPTETFGLCLNSPTGGATLGTVCGTGTILDYTNNCRQPVVVTRSVAGGKLNVTVTTPPFAGNVANPIQQIAFGQSNPSRGYQNARVTMNGQNVASGQVVTLPANSTTASFTVERVTAGQPTTVHLTVANGCGEWKTFVGGGGGAGF